MKSEIAFFKDKRWRDSQAIIATYRFLGFTDDEIIAEMKKIMASRSDEPSPSDVSVTQDVSTDSENDQSIENTNPDYYKDELYLDEDFRMLAKTYPADVSAIGVTTLIDYVEAVEAELASRINELHYANTVCMEQKHKIARRDEIIARLKEDGDRLASTYVIEVFQHEWVCRGGCHHWARFGEQIEHSPGCPITIHRALMKELE